MRYDNDNEVLSPRNKQRHQIYPLLETSFRLPHPLLSCFSSSFFLLYLISAYVTQTLTFNRDKNQNDPKDPERMDLHPHLHLLVPSSSPGINLEIRFYLPREILDSIPPPEDTLTTTGKSKCRGWSNTSTSSPVPVGELEKGTVAAMGRVERLIIASHPWGRFGGNMLYP